MAVSLPKTVYAIQHLAFEDLGSLEDAFYQLGFRVRYFEAGVDDLSPALNYEGLTIILGGPIGVYETEDYPFLIDEIALLKQRLAANKPTIGICLGAQLIAHALGAKVYAGPKKRLAGANWTFSLLLKIFWQRLKIPMCCTGMATHSTYQIMRPYWQVQLFILIKPLQSESRF